MTASELTKNTVSNKVYEQLSSEILSGKYPAGTKIPSENELCAAYACSRNTLRSAIQRLNALGLLETRRGDGSYVQQFGVQLYINTFVPAALVKSDSLMDLIQLRKAIEVAAAQLAAEKATEEDITALEECFRASTEAGENMKVYAETTIDFHYQIAIASKNEIFFTLMEMIKYLLTSKMEDFLHFSRSDRYSTYYHGMILEAIKNHKPEEAAYLMEKHMNFLVEQVNLYNESCKKES